LPENRYNLILYLDLDMHTIPETHQLYLMGDYHGNHDLLTEILVGLSMIPEPVSLIMLGDYDIHKAAQLSNFEDELSQYDVDCYLMRGNHDNPKLWQDRGISGVLETSKFKLLEEIDVIQWRGKRILAVGGAVSVDRTCIRYDEGHCWPKIEGIDPNATDKVKNLVQMSGLFDVMLSHTGLLTDVASKNDFVDSFASTDDHLYADMEKERKTIERLLIVSGAQESYFGHFHQKWMGEEYGVDLRCLDICEILQM
jgi:predicted phosphodiesterase